MVVIGGAGKTCTFYACKMWSVSCNCQGQQKKGDISKDNQANREFPTMHCNYKGNHFVVII